MGLDENIKRKWASIQEQYDYPVDALGRPIDPKDQETLKVWKAEGIDQFVKR